LTLIFFFFPPILCGSFRLITCLVIRAPSGREWPHALPHVSFILLFPLFALYVAPLGSAYLFFVNSLFSNWWRAPLRAPRPPRLPPPRLLSVGRLYDDGNPFPAFPPRTTLMVTVFLVCTPPHDFSDGFSCPAGLTFFLTLARL